MKIFTNRIFFVSAAVVTFIVLSSTFMQKEPKRYHSKEEMNRMMMTGDLPAGTNSLFVGSGKCSGCHGHDTPFDENDLVVANQTEEGLDVNPSDDWRATMMANSAKDPFWQAKVTHEVSLYPQHQEAIEDKCTSCHAPVGKFAHQFDGDPHYSFADLVGDENNSPDTLALDGVNCGACHQQRPETIGQFFSGFLDYSPDTVFGPYISDSLEFPIVFGPMNDFVGFMPIGDPYVAKSEMCASCHTLLTQTLDFEGNTTGNDFVEQATYHEWLNSAYNNDPDQKKECQGCHLPRLPDEEEIVLASGYNFLPGRSPFGQHWLVGGNSFMLELMKNRIDELGITATPEHFNKVIERTLDQLQTQTATVEISTDDVDGDTARYTVKLTNLAGHKFPSGYPSRRAYIEFTATDNDGNILWQSGGLNPEYEVYGQNPDYEPHYEMINDPSQVQIYELVMADVNGDVTTVLERADQPIKDNRLPPLGFSTEHFAYDTTMIAGSAATDPNFNWLNGEEGSGTDEISYHIPVTGFDGVIHVSARLMYQSAPPKWNAELFSVSTPKIDAFEEMYWEEGPDPVQVGIATTESLIVGIAKKPETSIVIYPNPTADGNLTISSEEKILAIRVYNTRGKLLNELLVGQKQIEILLPETSGTYLLEIVTSSETRIEKVLRK